MAEGRVSGSTTNALSPWTELFALSRPLACFEFEARSVIPDGRYRKNRKRETLGKPWHRLPVGLPVVDDLIGAEGQAQLLGGRCGCQERRLAPRAMRNKQKTACLLVLCLKLGQLASPSHAVDWSSPRTEENSRRSSKLKGLWPGSTRDQQATKSP